MENNPLGPTPKREVDDTVREEIANREAQHQAHHQPPPDSRRTSPIVQVFLLVLLCGLGYWIYTVIQARREAPEEIVEVKPPRQVDSDISSLTELLQKRPRLLYYTNLSQEDIMRASRQSQLFLQVINSPAESQPAPKANALDKFPAPIYFSRPKAGRYTLGTRDKLESEFGSSNVFSMSHSLWSSFHDKLEQAGNPPKPSALRSLQEEAGEAFKERDPNNTANRNQDDINKARDAADLAWLSQLRSYLNQLSPRTGATTSGRAAALQAWNEFRQGEGADLPEVMESQVVHEQIIELADQFSIPDGEFAVVAIVVGDQEIYLVPDVLPSWFSVSRPTQ